MKKVSLISPCYNGSKYLKWFLDSLVEQTYQNVEFIFVNDGSTDDTEEIFMSYKPKLEEKGWNVIYIKQENKGQAEAINRGLKIFTGDYLIFPDSDDILYPNHIEEKVNFMEKNPDCGLAYNVVDVVNEIDVENVLYQLDNSKKQHQNFSDRLLVEDIAIWGSVSNILRSKYFLDVIPHREIYSSSAGQNFQILFPLSYKYPVMYLKKSLGKYVVRHNSHSHNESFQNIKPIFSFDVKYRTIFNLEIPIEKKWRLLQSLCENFKPLRSKNIKLFNLVPFIKIKRKNNKTRVYLFGVLVFSVCN